MLHNDDIAVGKVFLFLIGGNELQQIVNILKHIRMYNPTSDRITSKICNSLSYDVMPKSDIM